jgi:selenide, water dikinase
MASYKLTEFSHGAGCGCKISPQVLSTILEHQSERFQFPGLLVGNDNRDDAAAFDLGDGTVIVSTTDFFMPIVDDPVDFGRIASVNAISDVYAMGGTPLVAIAILGWPVDKLPAEVANKVIEGGRLACQEAGIPLAGGHSIDSPEPIFGLAVTGRVKQSELKRNSSAQPGDRLFLTKPLGVGILSTAQKKKKLRPEHAGLARDNMVKLNKAGETFARLPYVHAMTDVTGFGLLGHLVEMCEASGTKATLLENKVPFIERDVLEYYLSENCVPGGTHRNWESYGQCVEPISEQQRYLLADPQTSGGLLVSVAADQAEAFRLQASQEGLLLESIGYLAQQEGDKLIQVVQ